MRVVVQRVLSASVAWQLDGERGEDSIGRGLLLLVGVGPQDGEEDCRRLAYKLASLRLFPEGSKVNHLSLVDIAGEALVVSQFTLYGDLSRGRRPSFVGAAAPEQADRLYQVLVAELASAGVRTATGRFGAHMEVNLVNDGPVTLVLSTDDWSTRV